MEYFFFEIGNEWTRYFDRPWNFDRLGVMPPLMKIGMKGWLSTSTVARSLFGRAELH
jgi:hypothetical protein